MGIKDKAMFALYLAAKKRKANGNKPSGSSNNYYDYDDYCEHDD